MAANTLRMIQVDVFTNRAFGGNPLAVFPDAPDFTVAQMQAIAREMNLSETTFVRPATRADCVAQLRIFTPARELSFAGHPTIGTAWVLATLGRLPGGEHGVMLQEEIGPVAVRTEGPPLKPSLVWMRPPPATFEASQRGRAGLAAAVGLAEDDLLPGAPIEIGSTGVPFLYVPVRNRQIVDAARADAASMERHSPGVLEVMVFCVEEGNRTYSRMFAPGLGIAEDPATGSAAGPLGVYLLRNKLIPRADVVDLLNEQGTRMGRKSDLHIRIRPPAGSGPDDVEVGGAVVSVLEGSLTHPWD